MRARAAAVALVLSAGLLAGCSTDVRGEIRGQVADITRDANARDAGAVRRGVDDLLALLDDAVARGELTSAEAADIAAIAAAVRERAALLETVPTPTPTTESPTPTPTEESPTPTPTQEPEETEEPEGSEEPEPTEEPEQSEAPAPSPTPSEVVPTVVPGALEPSAEPEPTTSS